MRSVIHSRKLPGKLSKSLALCALLTTGHLHAQTVEDELGKDRIVTQELDPSKPIIVRTMPTVTTTVQFPEPVDALDGKGMVVDESKDLGRFQIGWQQGSRFVSVLPLVSSGSMNINVITGGKVYVMLLLVDVHFDWIVRLVPLGSLELVENLLKQQQQQKLDTQQTKERQSLQAKQEQDHARLPQKPANEPKQQPLEQKHQQQTTQLAAKHTQQQQQLQQHQQPAAHAAAPKQSKEGKG